MNIEKFIKEDLKVRVKLDEKWDLYVNCYDVALGLFSRIRTKNGKEYEEIRWERVNEYTDKKFPHYWGKEVSENSWLIEGEFYKLLMKMRGSDNEKALRFQNWLAFEVLPSLRKNSFYIDTDNLDKEKFEELKTQFDKLKLTMFDVCEMGKISLGKASELLLGDKHELKHRFIKLGWLDYDKCQVVQRKFKASNGKVYELFVYNVSGTYDKGKVSQKLQVSLTNAGYIWLKDKIEKDSKWGVM